VEFSLKQGNRYFARIAGEQFFVGERVPYGSRKGLANLTGTAAQRYDRVEHRAEFGFWADFIHPTVSAEGAFYHALNTYDRARFTFACLQFAAHVPNGDFVRFFRTLLQLPLAPEYFPDLQLHNGRIARATDGGPVALETDQSTARLLDYLNPSAKEVEDTEVIQAAKFVHWAQHDARHRRAQIEVGIALFRAKMAEYAKRYALDGAADDVCLVVSDIRHQGRAKSPAIIAALQSAKPLEALLTIGEPMYHSRLLTLRREVRRLTDEGTLGTRKYDAASREFVPG
jgi:hypothetical protein